MSADWLADFGPVEQLKFGDASRICSPADGRGGRVTARIQLRVLEARKERPFLEQVIEPRLVRRGEGLSGSRGSPRRCPASESPTVAPAVQIWRPQSLVFPSATWGREWECRAPPAQACDSA